MRKLFLEYQTMNLSLLFKSFKKSFLPRNLLLAQLSGNILSKVILIEKLRILVYLSWIFRKVSWQEINTELNLEKNFLDKVILFQK